MCIIKNSKSTRAGKIPILICNLKLETLYVDDGWIAGGGAKQSYAKGEVGVDNGLVES